MNNYINKEDFKNELIRCQKIGTLSEKMGKDILLICTNVSNKYSYNDKRNKEDCVGYAVLEVLKYWKKYDGARSDNAFAFITQIAFHGLNKGFVKLKCTKCVELVFIDIFNIE